jgi:hypothetical protein
VSETKKAWIIAAAMLSTIAVAVWLGIRSMPSFDLASRKDYGDLPQPDLLRLIAATMHVHTLPASARGGHMYREGFQDEEVWASFEIDPSDIQALQKALERQELSEEGVRRWQWSKLTAPLSELVMTQGRWDRLTKAPERIKVWWSLPSTVLSYWFGSWREGRSNSMCVFDEKGGRFWFYHWSF